MNAAIINKAAKYEQVQRISYETLISQHTVLVRRIAYHLKGRLPPNVEVEDLIQAGMIGLFEAAQNYLPSRTANFETYAGIRIRGAMLDELRKIDWTPRSVHRKIREAAEAARQVEKETGTDATDSEVARRLGITISDYNQILTDAASCRLLSLSEDEDNESIAFEVADRNDPGPAGTCEKMGLRTALIQAIHELPERERLVMSLYYDEEMNLKEIGLVLGVTESRVCQLHGKALVRLRTKLAEWRSEQMEEEAFV